MAKTGPNNATDAVLALGECYSSSLWDFLTCLRHICCSLQTCNLEEMDNKRM